MKKLYPNQWLYALSSLKPSRELMPILLRLTITVSLTVAVGCGCGASSASICKHMEKVSVGEWSQEYLANCETLTEFTKKEIGEERYNELFTCVMKATNGQSGEQCMERAISKEKMETFIAKAKQRGDWREQTQVQEDSLKVYSAAQRIENEAINAMVLESTHYSEQVMILTSQFNGDCTALVRDVTAHVEPHIISLRRTMDDLAETTAERERIAQVVTSRGKAQQQASIERVEAKLGTMGKTAIDVTEAVARINTECADNPGWTAVKARSGLFN